jgi:methionine biosynthesis protein MetW
MNRTKPARPADIRVDLLYIASLIEPGSRVLDIGCGDGALLEFLARERGVDARGIEISRTGVNACVARGLSVVQGDADTDLVNYPAGAFDYVILSQTLQAMRQPRAALMELLRIGRRVIVSFPNFGYWKVRLLLLFTGRMPDTPTLDQPWYSTPNIHLCTVRDFVDLCRDLGVTIEQSTVIDAKGNPPKRKLPLFFENFFGAQGMFVLRYDGPRDENGAPVYPSLKG